MSCCDKEGNQSVVSTAILTNREQRPLDFLAAYQVPVHTNPKVTPEATA